MVPLPSSQKQTKKKFPNDQSAQQTPSSVLVISITYPSSATFELARVSPLLHTAVHELNGGCVRFISPPPRMSLSGEPQVPFQVFPFPCHRICIHA